jgi:hypothetical protein
MASAGAFLSTLFLAGEIEIFPMMLPEFPVRKGAYLISENHLEHRGVPLSF